MGLKDDEKGFYDIMDIEAMDDERLEKSESGKIQVTRVYIKSEVDAAIAELKAENRKLKRELEHVKNGDCINTCDVVEKHVKEEIKAKRALWLARAERARDNSILLPSKFMRNVWDNVERKCLKKAEKYK